MMNEYSFAAKERDIQLMMDVPPYPVYYHLNKDKFRRVYQNLMSNALKFTPASGTISLGLKLQSDHLQLIIADSGIGIPPEFQEILFDRFTKAKRFGLQGEISNGLGMSIVKQIVELHGGSITVKSENQKGTAFTIHLPM